MLAKLYDRNLKQVFDAQEYVDDTSEYLKEISFGDLKWSNKGSDSLITKNFNSINPGQFQIKEGSELYNNYKFINKLLQLNNRNNFSINKMENFVNVAEKILEMLETK